jgi:uncharacterized protein with PQ loop repeat
MAGIAHHFHITKKNEKRFISRLCSVFAVLMPLTVLPQIHLLYSTQNASGLSLTMWVLYMVGCIPFLIFGYIYKVRQLVVLNGLWLVMQTIMIVGILMYRS